MSRINKRFTQHHAVKSVPKMDPALYAVRRRVIQALYEARDLLNGNLPRLGVRIVETDGHTLGIALLGGNQFVIARDAAQWTEEQVRHCVWHEIAHAVFGADHVKGCPLMGPTRPKMIASRSVLAKAFLALARRDK